MRRSNLLLAAGGLLRFARNDSLSSYDFYYIMIRAEKQTKEKAMHKQQKRTVIKTSRFFLLTVLLAGMALGAIPLPVVRAADFNPGCIVGDLISAINTANGNGQPDTINLEASCTYTLTIVNNTTDGPNGLPSITSQIIIHGNGATIERSSAGGTPNFRIFHVAASGGDLTLTDVTIANGNASGNPGGGIFSKGVLNISNSTLYSNTADLGGGIMNSGGTLNINNSTLSGNTATNGCGTTYTTDQRGYCRPYPSESDCDIGAYEYGTIFGDVNCDCDVAAADVMLVVGSWQCQSGEGCYDGRYDLDQDGDIDIVDIMLVAHWGEAC